MDEPAARGLACLAKPFHLPEFMMWLADTDSGPVRPTGRTHRVLDVLTGRTSPPGHAVPPRP
jgi:hypothetical protein